MNEVFKAALSLSCSGALLILTICLLRPLTRKRLSQRWQYYIWLVVILRLLLPFTSETNLVGSIFRQIGHEISQAEHAPRPYKAPERSEILVSPSQDATAENGSHVISGAIESTRYMQVRAVMGEYICIIWLVITLVLFIRKITIYQGFVKYIRAGCAEVEEIGLLERFGNLVEQSGVKTNVELLTNPLVSSPLLIGFFRACIVLPTVELSDSDFQYTILHELTHCKRWDMFYKWLVQAVICIHWFNPFVYLMGREVERTCELSCDETVIRELDVSGRLAYGDTLLNAIDGGGRYKDSIAAVTLCECAERLRERLDAISGFHKKTRFVCTLSIVLTCTFCWGAVSVGAYTILPPSSLELRSSVELTLEEPENTLEEPKISIMVTAQTENITVVQGGDTLQIDFYAQNPDENNIELMTPLSKGRWNGIDIEFFAQNSGEYHFQPIASDNMHVSKMLGVGSSHSSGMEKDRWIEITVPQQLTLYELNISTTSGNIRVTDCTVRELQTDTQSGKIEISP